MKHAFLVIAHNNFGVLQRIVSLLDSEGFDFFIHIDKKVKKLPEIHASQSRVLFCTPRINVRWGDVSQIRCELTLLEFALSSGSSYDYYHIISGTHLPLVGPEGFNSYFADHPAAVFQPMETSEYEIDMKIRRWNLCTRTFKHPCALIERSSQMIWRLSNAMQRVMGIKRFRCEKFVKASQWCSLSFESANHLVTRRNAILNKYKWSFCGDEFFAVTEISERFGDSVGSRTNYLYQRFLKESPAILAESDLAFAKDFLWARKFEDTK